MSQAWVVSSSPHVRSPETTARIMWQVVMALIPAGLWSVYLFGFGAARLVLLCVVTAVVTEYAIQKIRKIKVTVSDGSAVLTGLLMAYVLPAYAPGAEGGVRLMPAYVPITGALVAIALAKQAFGGLGHNVWNPALAGRAFVQIAWPQYVSLAEWPWLRGGGTDAVTQATALANVDSTGDFGYTLGEMFFGRIPGSMGEVSALLILIGGIYLIARKYVDWRLPLSYIGVVFVGGVITGAASETSLGPISFGLGHILAGGLFLGAFFMATDMVTTPLTRAGQVIFGLGAGALTILIRLFTGYPEGVCYAILIMNMTTPLIDRHVKPKVYGSLHEKTEE